MTAAGSSKTILLSAGGTGGHLYPAEALAEELLTRGYNVAIITDKRGHAFKSLGDRVNIYTVRAATLKPGLGAKIRAVIDILSIWMMRVISVVSRVSTAPPSDLAIAFTPPTTEEPPPKGTSAMSSSAQSCTMASASSALRG